MNYMWREIRRDARGCLLGYEDAAGWIRGQVQAVSASDGEMWVWCVDLDLPEGSVGFFSEATAKKYIEDNVAANVAAKQPPQAKACAMSEARLAILGKTGSTDVQELVAEVRRLRTELEKMPTFKAGVTEDRHEPYEVRADRAKKNAFAVKLAAEHQRRDSGTRCYLSPHETEIRLVEVTPSVASSRDYSVEPPVLAPMFAMFLPWVLEYTTHLVLLSEEEWTAYEAGTLPLPEGWAAPVSV